MAATPEEFQRNIRNTDTQTDWSVTVMEVEKPEDYEYMNNMIVEFYSKNAETYNEDFDKYKYEGPQRMAEYIHEYLAGRVDAHILDVGAGTGLLAQALKKFGYSNIDAVDPSAGMLAVAQKSQLYKNTFIQRFTVDSGLPAESYDAVVCIGAFLPGHLKSDAIKEMYALLKPGGYILFAIRKENLEVDPDLSKISTWIAEMVAGGKLSVEREEDVKKTFLGSVGSHQKVLRKF